MDEHEAFEVIPAIGEKKQLRNQPYRKIDAVVWKDLIFIFIILLIPWIFYFMAFINYLSHGPNITTFEIQVFMIWTMVYLVFSLLGFINFNS